MMLLRMLNPCREAPITRHHMSICVSPVAGDIPSYFVFPMTRPYFSGLVLLLVLTCSAFGTDKPKITFDEFFNSVDFTAVQISPDGNFVVIATERADWDREIYQTDLRLYRDDVHGGSLTQLTQSGHDSVPRWSPDGRWIAFLSEREPPSGKGREGDENGKDDKAVAQIYLISPNGGETFPITSGDEAVHTFNWSPTPRRFTLLPDSAEQRSEGRIQETLERRRSIPRRRARRRDLWS